MQALQNGDRKRAMSALDSTAERDLQLKDEHARTVLHYAAWRGYRRIVEKLLDKIQVGIADRFGKQAFHFAAERGHKRTIKVLMEHIDEHRPCGNGQTLLHRAVLLGSLPVVELVLTKYHAIDHQDLEGRAALHWAVLTRHSELVKLLVSKGANQSLKDASGRTVLHLAAMSGDLKDEVVGLFLGAAALNVADRCGRMPLHYAAERGFVSLATLLQGVTDLDMQDSGGDTALHLASRNGHEKVVARLLGKGASPNQLNNMGKSALHLAAAAGQLEIVVVLVQHGANIWLKNWDNATPVMIAAKNGHHRATTVLAEYMVKISSMPDGMASKLLGRYKLTLHDAAQYGCPVLAEKLLTSGVDIHKRDASGMTPLLLAVRGGEKEVADVLLGVYADRFWDLADWFTPDVNEMLPPLASFRNMAKSDKQSLGQMYERQCRFESAIADLEEARSAAQENGDTSMLQLLATFRRQRRKKLLQGGQ
jgi:ankyrin repeat protein